MKRKISFITAILILSIPSFGQFGGFTFGYKFGNTKLETYKYQYSLISDESMPVIFSNQTPANLKTRSLSVGAEVIFPNFFMNFSTEIPFWKYHGSMDIGFDGKPEAKLNTFDFTLAGGFDIEKKVSVLFGLQLGHTKHETLAPAGDSISGLTAIHNIDPLHPSSNPDYLMFDYFGAFKKGANITLLVQPNEYVCIRNTFFANRATYKGIPDNQNWYGLGYKGFDFSNELALYLKIEYVGVKFQYTYEMLKLNVEKIDEDAPYFIKYIPSNKAIFNNFSISLLFAFGKI